MKRSITLASLLAVGSSAAGAAAALPSPYYGSDTLFNVTRTAISTIGTIGASTLYVGGGSGGAAAAMSANGSFDATTQQTGPMSRMMKKEFNVCSANGDSTFKGNYDTNASGIVIGLDAVAVMSSTGSGGQTATSGSCNGAGGGVLQNGSAVGGTSFFKGGVDGNNGKQNWKWALALLYGGLDLSTANNGAGAAGADCNSAQRRALIANWQNLFQGGCAMSTAAGNSGISPFLACNPGTYANGTANTATGTVVNGQLWHAFRRDDTSGTADVFGSILGLSGGPSNAYLSGSFLASTIGYSPYCNALNWESTIPLDKNGLPAYSNGVPQTFGGLTKGTSLYPDAVDNTNCTWGTGSGFGLHDQYKGPGGVPDPLSVAGTCKFSGHCISHDGGATAGRPCVVGAADAAHGAVCGNSSLGDPSNDICVADFCTASAGPADNPTGCTDLSGSFTGANGYCSAAKHRMPPPNTWGTAPFATPFAAYDILPTQMQDNDPVRHPCIGGTTNNHNRIGEEVCGSDNQLGVVLPMVDTDWINSVTVAGHSGITLTQYATNTCNGNEPGNVVQVQNCAPKNFNHHDGACPNNDAEYGGVCVALTDATNGRSDCFNTAAYTPSKQVRPTCVDSSNNQTAIAANAVNQPCVLLNVGRVYNLYMNDGTVPETNGGTNVGYAQYPVPALGTNSLGVPTHTTDMVGAFNRIHSTETMLGAQAPGCQFVDMTDQIGCLSAADPCSIGFAGYEATNWSHQHNGFTGSTTDPYVNGGGNATTWDAVALQVAGVTPSAASVQALGAPGGSLAGQKEYQFSRKLYFNSLRGFGTVHNSTADGSGNDEITLAGFESSITPSGSPATTISAILQTFSYFSLGSQSPQGTTDQPFCEDFNEATICGNTANSNGCVNNNGITGDGFALPGEPNAANALPAKSTICGDGQVEAYEECDPGQKNGTTVIYASAGAGLGGCSATCRCNLDYNYTLGHCN
jgi:hypothetical protein